MQTVAECFCLALLCAGYTETTDIRSCIPVITLVKSTTSFPKHGSASTLSILCNSYLAKRWFPSRQPITGPYNLLCFIDRLQLCYDPMQEKIRTIASLQILLQQYQSGHGVAIMNVWGQVNFPPTHRKLANVRSSYNTAAY